MNKKQSTINGNNIIILSNGGYLPKNLIKNEDLDKSLETNDEWIRQRTGITKRHIASSELGENTASMAYFAANDCIQKYKLINKDFLESEIGLIITATITPNKIFPSVAAQVASLLKIKDDVFVFDVNAVCSGFLYAYIIANNILSSNEKIKNALIIGSETMSSILDWKDRSTCVLFGDGAGAILIGRNKNSQIDLGLIDYISRSDGSLGDILYANNNIEKLKMNGKEVFITASKELERCILDLCKKNSIEINEIDNFYIHQSNARILKLLSQNLNIDPNKILNSISEHANTSASSIPLLMNKYPIKPNSKNIIAAVGGGMVWGAALVYG